MPKQVRKLIGLTFTTTPPELTEEVRISVPSIDLTLQRGLSKQWYVMGRLQSQVLQNAVGVGVRWARPLTDRLFIGAGLDGYGWIGALKVKDVFNSQAYGAQAFPNATVGYRLTRDLQVSVKGEAIMDLYYRSQVGTLAVVYNQQRVNGFAVSFVLEQPFFNKQHVAVGFRAAYSNFNWQLWSLFDTFDRNLFYPQFFFGFIL